MAFRAAFMSLGLSLLILLWQERQGQRATPWLAMLRSAPTEHALSMYDREHGN